MENPKNCHPGGVPKNVTELPDTTPAHMMTVQMLVAKALARNPPQHTTEPKIMHKPGPIFLIGDVKKIPENTHTRNKLSWENVNFRGI